MNRTAKAAVLTQKTKLEILNLPIPSVQNDAMLIKVDVVSICGSDVHYYKNTPPFPAVLGHEVCGTIVEMGKHAKDRIHVANGTLQIGDRVCVYPGLTCGKCRECVTYGEGLYTLCRDTFAYGDFFQYQGEGNPPYTNHIDEYPYLTGGFAEYMYIYPNTYVWKVPDSMDSCVASLLDPLACATRAVELAQCAPGVLENGLNFNSNVLIIGNGAIGIFAALNARLLGVKRVIMSGTSEFKLNRATEIADVDATLNIRTTSAEERYERLMELTDGVGADTVINCVGGGAAFREGTNLMRRMGTLVDVGNAINPAPVEFDVQRDLCYKHGTYRGMMVTTPQVFNKAFTLLLQNNKLHLDKVLTHQCTLDTLEQTIRCAGDPDYIKGYVTF